VPLSKCPPGKTGCVGTMCNVHCAMLRHLWLPDVFVLSPGSRCRHEGGPSYRSLDFLVPYDAAQPGLCSHCFRSRNPHYPYCPRCLCSESRCQLGRFGVHPVTQQCFNHSPIWICVVRGSYQSAVEQMSTWENRLCRNNVQCALCNVAPSVAA